MKSDARRKTLERKRALIGAAALGVIGCKSATTGSGYEVVDPMPEPARCPDLESKMPPQTAKILEDKTLELVVPSPPKSAGWLSHEEAPHVYGGTLIKTTTAPDSITLVIRPEATEGTVSVGIRAGCEGFGNLTMTVEVSYSLKEGRAQTRFYEGG